MVFEWLNWTLSSIFWISLNLLAWIHCVLRFFVCCSPFSRYHSVTRESRRGNIPRDQRTIKLESSSWKREWNATLGESKRREDMTQWGEGDTMKMFLPVTEDRMWLHVWLELEGHSAFAVGWDRWVMTSSHLWGKRSDRSGVHGCTVARTYKGGVRDLFTTL